MDQSRRKRIFAHLAILTLIGGCTSAAAGLWYSGMSGEFSPKRVANVGETLGARSFASNPVAVTPKSSDSFVEGIGVDTHLTYSTYQAQLGTIKTLLSQSGIRFIRDGLPGTDNTSTGFKVFTDNLSQLVTPQGNRVKLLLSTSYGEDISSSNYPTHHCFIVRVKRIVQAGTITCGNEQMHSTVGGTPLVAVEGPNEVDHCGSFETACQTGGGTWYDKSLRKSPNWPVVLPTYMQDLKTVLASEPATSGVSILAPSLVHIEEYSAVATAGPSNLYADMKASFQPSISYGNLHAYCDDFPLSTCLTNPANLPLYQLNSPKDFFSNKPLIVSETGYSRYNASGNDSVTQVEQSKMGLRSIVDLFDLGASRYVFYEFYDQGAGAATPREGNFGLVGNNGTPKLAYTSLKNTISLLQETPGTSITATPLSYAITSTGSAVKGTLLRKSTGTYYLLLRNEVASVSDADQNLSATLDFGTAIESLKTYRPSLGTGVQGTFTGQSITLTVPDDLLIAEVTLASASSASSGQSGGSTTTATPKAGSTAKSTAKATTSPEATAVGGTSGTGNDEGQGSTGGGTAGGETTIAPGATPGSTPAVEEFVAALSSGQYAGMLGGSATVLAGIILGVIERVRRLRRLANLHAATSYPPHLPGGGGLLPH